MSGVLKLGNVTLGTENSGKVDLTNVGATTADSVTATNLTGTVTNLPSSLTALDTAASNGATSNLDNSALPLFGCRAFVNFNGTTYVSVSGENHCAIRSSGNVSKVVRNTTGTFTIHFITAMPDTNYVVLGSSIGNVTNYYSSPHGHADNVIGTTSVKIALPATLGSNIVLQDIDTVQIVIFR